MMTETIQDMVAKCAPWESNDVDFMDQQEYLISLLSTRREDSSNNSNNNSEELLQIVDQFFESPEHSQQLVELWKTSFDVAIVENSDSDSDTGTTTAITKLGLVDAGSRIDATTIGSETQSVSLTEDPRNIKDKQNQKTTQRRTTRNKDRSNRKKKSRSPRGRKPETNRTDHTGEGRDGNENENESLREAVSRIHDASNLDLDDTDDFATAWRDAQDAGRVWGGRGYGGRGVNRGLGTYKGRDAVVDGLTLFFSGRELLSRTHLVVANGHRYGLWGKNGVGKSTLLRRIATGRLPGWPMHLSVRMVGQEVLGTSKTVRECMLGVESIKHGNTRRKMLEEELASMETQLATLVDENDAEALEKLSEQMSELYEELEDIERTEVKKEERKNELSGEGAASRRKLFAGFEESAVAILRGLGFEGSMLDTPVDHLSGGWRMRVALAEALYFKPDVLLLDEPTNHLDASAIVFLEDHILEHDVTLVVVSHDGHFLDAVCTDMIKFENQKLEYHVGNFSTFRQREEELWAKNRSIADATARKEKKAMEFIQKQKSMSNSKRRDDNKQRQARERERKLGRIGLYSENGKKFKLLAQGRGCVGVNRANHIQGSYTNTAGFSSAFVNNSGTTFGEQHQLLNFRFPSAPPLKGATAEHAPLITMENCRFRYPPTSYSDDSETHNTDPLLRDLTLSVSVGSRIAILGKNGSGKSTLLKLLCGKLAPDKNGGTLRFHSNNLKIACVSQHHIEQLGSFLGQSPVEYLLGQSEGRDNGCKNEFEARRFLGGFGLCGPLALQPIGTLSGGQKARLAFASVLCGDAPHVLVLDEPTNHLDGDSLSSLSEALSDFGGAVVAVSHHQGFLSGIAREVWTVGDDGTVGVERVASAKEDDRSSQQSDFDDLYARYREGLRRESRGTRNRTR